MRVVCLSDTHRKHQEVDVPLGDMLIYAGDGDWTTTDTLMQFLDWFEAQPHPYKIMIAGNHDFLLEQECVEKHIYIKEIFTRGIIYLENSGIDIDKYKIWGSPISPRFCKWAFMADRGKDIAKYWDMIPNDTDILITHTPPMYKLDKIIGSYEHLGCYDLAKKISELHLKLNVFGHIHSNSSITEVDGTIFCNASVLNEAYQVAYEPKVVELSEKGADLSKRI